MIDKKHGIVYNTNMNIVIDTNVIVSGLQSDKGYSYKLLKMLPDSRFDICISVPLILEYEEQIKYHLADFYTADELNGFIDYICSIAKNVSIYYLWRPFLKDSLDDHVLELAIASQSKYIITFNVRDFAGAERNGITVLKPKEFINLLEERR